MHILKHLKNLLSFDISTKTLRLEMRIVAASPARSPAKTFKCSILRGNFSTGVVCLND